MSTKATQRKALLNSLSGCSAKLKKHISKSNILTRNKLPLEPGELRKLVAAASLGDRTTPAMGMVMDIAE
jgi:hypothetical protein